MNKTIPIFFTIDEAYAPYFSVALLSLIDNANREYNYDIHIVHDRLSKETIKKIKTMETSNVKLIFTEMNKDLGKITNRKENFLREDLFTLTIYFRIFIPFMFEEYDKAIYIDSDVCIPGDISKLYNLDLGNNFFGGCKDISCQNNEILCNYFKENAGVSIDEYINSGVLLMNMKKLREVKFEEHFLYLLNKYHFDTVCPDQDYINVMSYGNILHLSNEWNAMPTGDGNMINNPKLIHYNLFFKPWHFDNVEYEDYFWKYASASIFKDKIYEEKNNYTKEKQDEDMKKLDVLVERASNIVKNENTFKKIIESGKESRI